MTNPTTVELLRSPVLSAIPGVSHGFSTRQGGLSGGVFSSLNLDYRNGDERQTVEANRRHLLDGLGRPDASWVSVHQVHGKELVEITHVASRTIEADALVSRDPRAAVAVLVADCVPILISSADGKWVGAIHAGWRGTAAKIAAVGVARLVSAGCPADSLRVAVGPAIGPCCFSIGEDVAQTLGALPGGAEAVRQEGSRWVADLWALNLAILLEAGVRREHIDVLRLCSSCSSSLFSHRRDRGQTGRQAGVIVASR